MASRYKEQIYLMEMAHVKEYIKKAFLIDLDWTIPCYATILVLASVPITGYKVYSANHAFQIPLVHLLQNPSLFPNDPFAATLPHYVSMLWRLVAVCANYIALESLLFASFLIERFLIIYVGGHLAHAFAPKSRLAVIGGMAFFALGPMPILAGGTIVTSFFEQTGLSIAFFLLAAVSFYQFRPISWAIWLAIGFNINIMYGAYAFSYFLPVFLFDPNYRKAWKKWGSAVILFTMFSFPVIILAASTFFREPTNSNLWLFASRIAVACHLYPLDWNKFSFVQYGFLFLVTIVLLHQNRKKSEKLFKHQLIWAGVSIGWLFYAFIAAYVAKSPSMLLMQPGRGTDLWYCFAAIGLISICAINVEENIENKLFIIVPFFAAIFFWRPFSAKQSIILLGLALLSWKLVTKYILERGGSNRRLMLMISLVLFLLGMYASSKRLKEHGDFIFGRPDKMVLTVANWAKENTAIEATFLVNPGSPSWYPFRSLSQRPVFTTWKDGCAILWVRPFVKTWLERLKMLGIDVTEKKWLKKKIPSELSTRYAKLRDVDVIGLNSIQYWVVPNDHPSNFRIAYQNKKYKVLALK